MLHRITTRHLVVLAVIGFLLLACWHLFSPGGAFRLYKIDRHLDQVATENRRLSTTNTSLQDEIELLENDPQYFEEVARKQFKMIRKNELLFDFRKKK